MEKQGVVIIDDSPDLRSRIKDVVESFVHLEVIGEANNGKEGTELIKTIQPDHVILDIRMPNKSGIYVLQSIKSISENINIIVLTNYADPVYKEKCIELGASYFLDKTNEFFKLNDIFLTEF